MKKGLIIGAACVCLLAGLFASTYALYQTAYNTSGNVETRHYNITTLAITTASDSLNSDTISGNESLTYGFFVSSKGELENDYSLNIVTTNKDVNISEVISVGSQEYVYSSVDTTTNCVIDDKFIDVEEDKDILVKILFTNNSSETIDVSNLIVSVSASVQDPEEPISDIYNFKFDMSKDFGFQRIDFTEGDDVDVTTTSGSVSMKKDKNYKFLLNFYDGEDEEFHYLKSVSRKDTDTGNTDEFTDGSNISDNINRDRPILEVVVPSYYEKENRNLYINYVDSSDFVINTFYNEYLAAAQDIFGHVYIINDSNSTKCISTQSDIVLNGDLTILSPGNISVKSVKAHGSGNLILTGQNISLGYGINLNGETGLVLDATGKVSASYNQTFTKNFEVLNSSEISLLGIASNNGNIYLNSAGRITTNHYPISVSSGTFTVDNSSSIDLGNITVGSGIILNSVGTINISSDYATVNNGDFVVESCGNLYVRGIRANQGNVVINSDGVVSISDHGVTSSKDLIVENCTTFTASGAISVNNIKIHAADSVNFDSRVSATNGEFTFDNRAYIYFTSNVNIEYVTINLKTVYNSRLLFSSTSIKSITINVLTSQSNVRVDYYDSSKITANGVTFDDQSENIFSIEYNPTAPITMNAVDSF